MKHIIKESLHWIVILVLICIFFIFLAWVAYPETFKLLVILMLIFSIFSIVMGMFFEWKKNLKHNVAFYQFIREPSEENERELIKCIGTLHKEKVNHLGNVLRNLQDQLEDAKIQTTDYKEFIESWVHEIKAPISLITLMLENRKEEMSKLVFKRMGHARAKINDQVEQILFFTRLQGSHVDYRFERISITDCLEEALFELQPLIDEKEINVISEMEDIPIVSDEKALLFIFTQIIVNAIKYSKDEGERFIYIKTGFDSSNNKYYVSISDNGIGVLKSDLPFIFDKGFTGDNMTKKQSTGIGLYLVKKLCDELHIEIEVDSKYGEGFEILFIFPNIE